MKSFIIALSLLIVAAPLQALQNQLNQHPSPYLAMHGDDPVLWQDWGPDVLDLARAQNKMIFISSGYFSCHWCHVMQRESYKSAQVAQYLNEHFIPVKIDRELHGALDSYLIDFLERTQGQGGWPLNIFLTPEGYPLIGATYVPPDRFMTLLQRLHGHWRDEPSQTRNLARRALLELMSKKVLQDIPKMLPEELADALVKQALSVADPMQGGFGQTNRFPMTPQLSALLRIQSVRSHPTLSEFLELTLDSMANEGLRDQLGGGFYRYTVDPSWQTPHYEKMLYTQAQLAEIYMNAAKILNRPDYLEVARDTLDFVIREMSGEQGGMVASFSAVDEQGEEGGNYLWELEQLDELLCERDRKIAVMHWRLHGPDATFGVLPRKGLGTEEIAAELALDPNLVVERIPQIKQILLEARAKRALPVDYKELAGWNGLMLAAFSRGAMELGDGGYAVAAQQIRDFLVNQLWNGEQLYRAKSDKKPIGKASLADYAYVAYGMAYYARLSGSAEDTRLFQQILYKAWQRFYDTTGWRLSDEALIPGMGSEFALGEGALPSPSAVILQLSSQIIDPVLEKKVSQAITHSRRKAQSEPFWYAGHALQLIYADATGRSN